MSGHPTQQLRYELINELTTSSQLLRLISIELQEIKELTDPGGDLASTISENTSLMRSLAGILQMDLENIPPLPMPRMTTDVSQQMGLRDTDSACKQKNGK